jgi:glutamine amidotransferase-like uncharacterized protein
MEARDGSRRTSLVLPHSDWMIDRRTFLVGTLSTAAAAAIGLDPVGSLAARRSGLDDKRPFALVYCGPASSTGIPEDTAAFLRTCPQRFRIAFCGPARHDLPISAETLAAASVFVQPGGGNDLRAAWESVKRHTQALRGFVRSGAHYLGLCMGGYLAGSGPGYDLLPGNCDDYTQTRGAPVHDERNAVITIDWPPPPHARRRRIFYQDGPYFWLNRGVKGQVLARYTNGLIAAMVVPFGRGRVAVCGPHPEANRSWFELAGLRYPGSTYDLGHQLVNALIVA